MVDFHATWCEPCKWAEPVVEQIIKHFDGKITLQKTDIDEKPEDAKMFHVLSVPTFILFKNGQEVWRMRGFDIPPKMIQSIEKIIG